jgi:PKHD-type hydroxylase
MIIRLTNLMKPDEAARIVDAFAGEAPLNSGQPLLGSAEARRVGGELRGGIMKNGGFSVAAMPRRMTNFNLHRMDEGMSHAVPINQAVIDAGSDNPVRADLWITLFLNPPEDYDGGELAISVSTGAQKLKMAPGDAVIYPANDYHYVEQVTRGMRWTAEAAIQSIIREEEQRNALTELWSVLNWMEKAPRETAEKLGPSYHALKRAHANLHRYWADV